MEKPGIKTIKFGSHGKKPEPPKPEPPPKPKIATGELAHIESFDLQEFAIGAFSKLSALDEARAVEFVKCGVEVYSNPDGGWIISVGGEDNVLIGADTPESAVHIASGLVKVIHLVGTFISKLQMIEDIKMATEIDVNAPVDEQASHSEEVPEFGTEAATPEEEEMQTDRAGVSVAVSWFDALRPNAKYLPPKPAALPLPTPKAAPMPSAAFKKPVAPPSPQPVSRSKVEEIVSKLESAGVVLSEDDKKRIEEGVRLAENVEAEAAATAPQVVSIPSAVNQTVSTNINNKAIHDFFAALKR